MLNRFLRTASTQRLLATLAGFVVAIAGGTAIALAAQGSGPVPKPKRLAVAIHSALASPQVTGISADINFTNHLIDASELQGTDPLLQGGSGHIWVSADGQFRLELYGDNGDPEIVVNRTAWWVSDPVLQTVYEGTLPGHSAGKDRAKREPLPTVARIQAALNRLARHLRIGGAAPTDVGGQPTYTVTVAPKRARGLLGQLQLAWDAAKGVPLRFAVYARGDHSPALEVKATNVSYGPVDASVFDIQPPAGYHSVTVATPTGAGMSKHHATRKHSEVTGTRAVARRLGFHLAAPASLAGLRRQSSSLLGKHGAVVVYGRGLGGVAVIEQAASASGARRLQLSRGAGDHQAGVSLPTFSVRGTQAQELDTALGTFVRFTSGGVTYTVIGSVTPAVARAAARAL